MLLLEGVISLVVNIVAKRLHRSIFLVLVLLFCFPIFFTVLAQEVTPAPEPPTAEPPTSTYTDIAPSPSATFTELPSLTPTFTETPTLLETFAQTPTALEMGTETPIPPLDITASPAADTITPIIPTAIPSLPSTLWSAVFSDTFDAINSTNWLFTGMGWGYAPQPDGTNSLRVFNSSAPVLYSGDSPFGNIAIETLANVSTGNAVLYTRFNNGMGYEAELTTFGELRLRRAGVAVSQTILLEFNAAYLHRLRFTSYQDLLWIDVDGLTALRYIDSEPLPLGAVGFGATFQPLLPDVTPVTPQNTVTFHEVTIYEPLDHFFPTATIASTSSVLLPTFPFTPITTYETVATPPATALPLPENTAESTVEIGTGADPELTQEFIAPESTETVYLQVDEVPSEDASDSLLFGSLESSETLEQVHTISFDSSEDASYTLLDCEIGEGRTGAGWKCTRSYWAEQNGRKMTFSPHCNVSYVSFDIRTDTSYPHTSVNLYTSSQEYWINNNHYSGWSGWTTYAVPSERDNLFTPSYVDTFYLQVGYGDTATGYIYVDNIHYRCLPDSTQPDTASQTSIIDFDGDDQDKEGYTLIRCGVGVGRENLEGDETAGWQCSRPSTTAPNGGLLGFSPQ